jgi:hypothetical protein
MTYLLVRNESVSLDEIMGRPIRQADGVELKILSTAAESRQGSASSKGSRNKVAPGGKIMVIAFHKLHSHPTFPATSSLNH